jgi:hypothetical protein
MQNSEQLKNIAIKILEKSKIEKTEYGFDPITILMIISVVLTCIRILQECNKNKLSSDSSVDDKCSLYQTEIQQYSIRRGWFSKMRIKKILRSQMKPEDYNKYSFSIINALFDTGETLTKEETKILMEAANV